jgi:hypothetical protein
MDPMNDDKAPQRRPALGRRDLMKLGAGFVGTALGAPNLAALAQGGPAAAAPADRPVGVMPYTRAGWINDANRASGNGPMDDTSRQIVKYVSAISESILTTAVVHAVDRTMVDTMACLISGFESEPARICARLARMTRSDLKSSVLG